MIETDNLFYEKKYRSQGFSLIAGTDEAGRGPLAGPVTAACCIMDLDHLVLGVDDSKKLSERRRMALEPLVKERAICYGVVHIEREEIDEINILNATKKAMKSALLSLFPFPDFLLTDAVKYEFGLPYEAIVHGDALSYSIASASILAKVARDRLMTETYAPLYPEYGFEKNKGYGTKYHIEALKKYGPCPIHRTTFIKNFF